MWVPWKHQLQQRGSSPRGQLWMAWHPCPHHHTEWWRARVLKTVVTEDNPDEFSIRGNSSSNPQPLKGKGLPCEAASSRPQFWYRTVQRYSQFYQGLCPVVINDSDRKSTTAHGEVASGTHMQIAMSLCTGVSVWLSLAAQGTLEALGPPPSSVRHSGAECGVGSNQV